MFKKDFEFSSENPLSSKDRKNLRKQLGTAFDDDSVGKLFLEFDTIFLKKVEKSKMLLYCSESDPLFVDASSKGDFFPTIYALQMCPHLIAGYAWLHAGAEKFALKGSPIDFKGVQKVEVLREFKADDVVGVKDTQGNLIAVGAISKKSSEIQADLSSLEGPAVFILSFKDDFLQQKGSMEIKGELKQEQVQVNQEEFQQEQKEEVQNELMDLEFMTGNKNKAHKGKKNVKPKGKTVFKDEEETKGKKEKNAGEKSDHENQQKAQEMDEILMESFLNGVILGLNDSDLPMENAKFWNDVISPYVPEGKNLDLKLTSFKKLGKFYQHLEKQRLIKYKEAKKKNDQAQVEAILRNNKTIEDWVPTVGGNNKNEKKKEKDTQEEKPFIHKSIKEFVTGFESIKKFAQPILEENCYAYEEWLKRVDEYLKVKGIVKGKKVKLTEEMISVLGLRDKKGQKEKEEDQSGSGESEEEENQVEEMDRQKLIGLMEKKVKFHFTYEQIRPELENKVKVHTVKRKFPGVEIVQETAHNKQITRIMGLQFFSIDPEVLLQIYKKRFDTSGSVQKEGTELIMQGAFGEQIKEHLKETFEFNERELVYQDKISKKNNKNKKH